jgi:hypothetical protein
MSWIKVLLIASALLVLVVLFRHRNRVLLRAGTRVAAVVLFLLAVVSIANPDIPQEVAQRVGVVRGTDLLLYLLVVVFTLTTLGLFFRLRETDYRVHQLARALAIQEALRREDQAALERADQGDRSDAGGPEEGAAAEQPASPQPASPQPAGEVTGSQAEEGTSPSPAEEGTSSQPDGDRSATTTNSLYANTFPAARGKGKE